MSERHHECVVRTEAASGRAHRVAAAQLPDERHDVFEQISLIGQIAIESGAWVTIAAVERLAVDGRYRDELEGSAVELVGNRADHAAILVLEETAHGRGEHDDRNTRMAEDEQLHVTVELAAVPAVIGSVHVGI
jgi:hypothetical protein